MRCVILAMALAARTQPSPAPRTGMLGRVLMRAAALADPVERFEGTFYGVSATVNLNMRTRIAQVQLRGAPLGGSISGAGWLQDFHAEAGGVVLDTEFRRRLSRRFVRVHSARLNRREHTVTVNARVPVLGVIEMVLR
tara:strand:+ start:10070 stop:10483 length:414 start_codon:yes stop_codon:yes gene_type:complete